jgi:hypothetical protein
MLDVAGLYTSAQLRLQRTGSAIGVTDIGSDSEGLKFWIGGYGTANLEMIFGSNGRVGIGTTTPDAKLTVAGDISSREVRVTVNAGTGPDYVFEKDYDLLPLSELEAYITQNKHLPEVPSAKQMEAEGLNLKEMNLVLLKKVEELTLYLIELEKRNSKQQIMIEDQSNRLVTLERKLKN